MPPTAFVRSLVFSLSVAVLVPFLAQTASASQVLLVPPDAIGTGLQSQARIKLDEDNPGSLVVTLSVDAISTGVCELALDKDAVGSSSIQINLDAPKKRDTFWVQGGTVATNCFINMSVDDPGWTVEQPNFFVNVVASELRFRSLDSHVSTGHSGDRFRIVTGISKDLGGGNSRFVTQKRAGGSSCIVQVCSDDVAVLDVQGEIVPPDPTCGGATIAANAHSTVSGALAAVPDSSLSGPASANLTASLCADIGDTRQVDVALETLSLRGPAHLAVEHQDIYTLRLSSPSDGAKTASIEVLDTTPHCKIWDPVGLAAVTTLAVQLADQDLTAEVDLQGVLEGTCDLSFSVPGYTSGTRSVSVDPPGLRITDLSSGYTLAVGSDRDEDFQVRVGIGHRDGRGLRLAQNVANGAGALDIDVSVENPAVALLEAPAGGAAVAAVTIDVAEGDDRTSVGDVAVQAIAVGETLVVAELDDGSTVPPFHQKRIHVSALFATLSNPNDLGSGLEADFRLRTNKSMALDTTLRVTTNPAYCEIWDGAQAVSQYDVLVGEGRSRSDEFTLLGVEGVSDEACDISWIAISGDPVGDGDTTLRIASGQLQIRDLARSLRSTGPDDDFVVRTANSKGSKQSVRRDFSNAMGLPVQVCSDDDQVVKIRTDVLAGAACQNVYVARSADQTLRKKDLWAVPVASVDADTFVRANAVGFAEDERPVRVRPGVTNIVGPREVGRDLQDTYRVSLRPRPDDADVVVTLSVDPSVCLLSELADQPGLASIDVTIVQGSSATSFQVQGIDEGIDEGGAPCVITAAPDDANYADGDETVQIVTPGLKLNKVPSTTWIGATDLFFEIQTGLPEDSQKNLKRLQPVRPGAAPLSVQACSSDDTILKINGGACGSADILVNEDTTPENALELMPVTPDEQGAEVCAIRAGFITTTVAGCKQVIPKDAYWFESVYTDRIGAGLMDSFRIKSPNSQAADLTLALTSTTPDVCLVAPDTSSVGQASINAVIKKGKSRVDFQVHAASVLPGHNDGETCTLEAQAVGLPLIETHIAIIPAAAKITYLKSSIGDDDPNDAFKVVLGTPKTQNNGVVVVKRSQQVAPRTGSAGLQVSVCSSDDSVGKLDLHDASAPDACRLVLVEAGQNHSRTSGSNNAARIEFDPQEPLPDNGGEPFLTTVAIDTITTTDFDVQPVNDGVRQVKVHGSAETVSMEAVNVGEGLVTSFEVTLSEGDFAALSVFFTTTNSTTCDVSNAAGGPYGSYTFLAVVPQQPGPVTVSGWVRGKAAGACQILAQVNHANYLAPADETTNVVTPAIQISGLVTLLAINDSDDFNVEIGVSEDGTSVNLVQQVAPSGSFDVDLSVSDPGLVSVAPASVTIAALASAATATLTAGSVDGPVVSVDAAAATPGELVETQLASRNVTLSTVTCGLGYEIVPLGFALAVWTARRRRRRVDVI